MTDNKCLTIHTDGGARGNPGPSACAFVAELGGRVVKKASKYLGENTNNFAEYQGVVLAATWLKDNLSQYSCDEIIFYLDSELVAKQLSGLYKIKKENLRRLFLAIKILEGNISQKIVYKNIPREKNKLADMLVNKELDKNH